MVSATTCGPVRMPLFRLSIRSRELCMTIQIWQAVIGPLLMTLLTLVFNGWHSSASISHQRTQRLRDLIYSGAWRTVHPMGLVMDVREAFGIQVALDRKDCAWHSNITMAPMRCCVITSLHVTLSLSPTMK